MANYEWNGPGALAHGGKLVKQGEEIPLEIVQKLSEKADGKNTSRLDDFIKVKSISEVKSTKATTQSPASASVEKKLAELTDAEITALSVEELSSSRFTKVELQAKAEEIGHKTVPGDAKKDFALSIFDYYHQG